MRQVCSIAYVQEEGRGGGWGDCVQSHTYKGREGRGVGQLCSITYIQEEGRGGGWGDCVQSHTYKRRGGVGGGVTVFNHIRTRGGEGWGVG